MMNGSCKMSVKNLKNKKYYIDVPVDESCVPDSRGLGQLFLDKMKENEDKVAQINGYTLETQNYAELLQRSICVAQSMISRGITSDDLIAICSYNTFDSCLPVMASLFLGVKVAPLDPNLALSDTEHALSIVQPKMIFCGPESVQLIEEALEILGIQIDLVVFGPSEKHIPFSEFLHSSGTEEEFRAKPVDIFDTAFVFFSSGTTGPAKGICVTHYGLIYQQRVAMKTLDPSVCLNFTTFYWITSVMVLIFSILSGGTRVICNRFDEKQVFKIIQNCKVTYVFISPFLINKLMQDHDIPVCYAPHLKNLSIGGGTTDLSKLERLRTILPGTFVSTPYGMTEGSGFCILFDPVRDRGLEVKKSCGRAMEGITYKVVNPETEEILGPNQPGELRFKSRCLMSGYYGNPKASAPAWDAEGFLNTGDIVYYDEEGCFYFIGRIKDILKYQSWAIIPYEIESVLLAHPAVREAVVIGQPDEIDREHPTGIVVLKPGAEATVENLVNFVEERVSDRKRLRGGVKFVDHIPRTATGKVKKMYLQDMFKTI